MLRLISVLIVLYPVIAHIGLWASYPVLAVSYLAGITLIALLFPRGYLKTTNVAIAIIIIAIVALLYFYKKTYLLIYLPPTVIPLFLMFVFGRSLQKEQVPVITQFAEKLEGTLSDEKKVYTRNITLLWVIVFAFMLIESVLLAVYTPIQVWSWYTHIGNYFLIAIVFALEFIYRIFRFKDTNRDVITFIRSLVRHKWK